MENHKFIYDALVYDCYDGDTIYVEVDLGFTIKVKKKLRLARIDTPELRGEERERGLMVRDLVRSMILGKCVIIKTYKDKAGKFGRYIAEVFLQDGTNLNDWLLENGHAVPYLD